MPAPPDDNATAELGDRMEAALRLFWQGDTAQLDQILEPDESSDPSVGTLLHGLLRSAARPFAGLETQTQVGSYRIIREIGRGGMGIVYEAEQQDPRRRVALKVLPGLYADEFHVKLFRREVRALAHLKHPAIATIYEAAQTEAGHHFFTMELVHGVPLNTYASGIKLPLRDRLHLFLKVCHAVHYAHQRGVIHRDLKPPNILVDADGNPKILDFGLARIADADTARTTAVTEAGKIMGTLAYMSPEQVRGTPDETDVRSDVYALGVVLYELLTDRPPHDLSRVRRLEAEQIICEQMPRRPGIINRNLPTDLDTIALKALEKEPSRRYPSALTLAEDVERYLANQPVRARPPSVVYRLRKFARRHKALAISTAVVLCSLALGVAGITWQAIRATREQQRALSAEQAAEKVISVLQDVLTSVDPEEAKGVDVTVREMLDDASERVATDFAAQPQTEVTLRETLGNTYRSLGLYAAAEPHLRAAVRIREQFSDQDPGAHAAALTDLAHLLRDTGRYDEAESLYRRSLAIRRDLQGPEHPEVAQGLVDLADLYYVKRDYDAAEQLCTEALAMRRNLGPEHEKAVAQSLLDLAELYHTIGDYDAARSFYDQALATHRRAQGEPLGAADIMNSLANLLRANGDLTAAEQMHREVLKVRREYLGDRHRDVGTSLMNLAALLRQEGNYAEAEQRYGEAVDIYREALGSEHKLLGGPLIGLGLVLTETGDAESAEPLLREALGVCQKTQPQGHWLIADAGSVLGQCLTALRRYEEAEPLVVEGHSVLSDTLGAEHRLTQEALARVVALYEAWGKTGMAAEYRALVPVERPQEPPPP
jgi:serine/threonine protein kinase